MNRGGTAGDAALIADCERALRERVSAAGRGGVSLGGLNLPRTSSTKGRAFRQALKGLLAKGEIGNLGSASRPRLVAAEHFKPLEIAYERLCARARESGLRLSSARTLSEGLTGAVRNRVDEALKLLVAEGVLVRLRWAGRPVYLHSGALPSATGGPTAGATAAATPAAAPAATPSVAAIRQAYEDTVRAFGYPDVLIRELHLRLGGELEPLRQALLRLCRAGEAVAAVGDWSLSSDEERAAALYLGGRAHLRIRLMP